MVYQTWHIEILSAGVQAWALDLAIAFVGRLCQRDGGPSLSSGALPNQ